MPQRQEPSQSPPESSPCLLPTSKASWEGCPSAAYISLHEVQHGLQLPADIQLKSFIFPSFALRLRLRRRSCCHLIIILNINPIRSESIYLPRHPDECDTPVLLFRIKGRQEVTRNNMTVLEFVRTRRVQEATGRAGCGCSSFTSDL